MEAKEMNFKAIMQVANVFKIPFFQRAYVWSEENWERFFNDLYESFKEDSEHFLGSVILKKHQAMKILPLSLTDSKGLRPFPYFLKHFMIF